MSENRGSLREQYPDFEVDPHTIEILENPNSGPLDFYNAFKHEMDRLGLEFDEQSLFNRLEPYTRGLLLQRWWNQIRREETDQQ